MKILPFAILLAISVAFLSCTSEPEESRMCKVAAKNDGEVLDYIKELDSYKKLDPICKTEQKKLVSFYDPPVIDWDYVYSHVPGGYKSGSGIVPETMVMSQGKVSYTVNGVELTQEQYDAYMAEYWRKYYEESEKNKRNLPIPCVIYGNVALLTDEEIAGLKKKYTDLIIEDYAPMQAQDGSSGGTSKITPTSEGCGR